MNGTKGAYMSARRAKAVALVLSVVMIVSALGIATVGASATTAAKNGWVKETSTRGDSIYKYYNRGEIVIGWLKSTTGKWYYLSGGAAGMGTDYGEMVTGWGVDNYLDKYYFGTDGALRTGWQKIAYTEASGTTGSAWYYLGADGKAPADGWSYVNGHWYYFAGHDLSGDGVLQQREPKGLMCFGLVWDEGELYYLGDPNDGSLKTGWQFLTPTNSNQTSTISYGNQGYLYLGQYGYGVWMYFESNGAAVRDTWKSIDGKWYYFNEYGVMAVGSYDGYVLGSKADGSLQTGWQKTNGVWYYYDAAGSKYQNQWLSYNGAWYYLGENGRMYDDEWVENWDGSWFYLGKGGVMLTGWYESKSAGAWYYFDANGAAHTGWLQLGSNWYFFDDDNQMIKGGILDVNGTRYYFDTNGALSWEHAVYSN
jgi:glucan-binding YG repeat protein